MTDIVYGIPGCKKLSKENPHWAANNAEAYEIFTETLFHFDQGIDAAITLQDGATYLFKGNFFVKFNNVVGDNLSQRFPSLLSLCFKDLPGTFARGFDSFVCHKAFVELLPLMVPSTFDLKTQTQMDYPQAIQSLGGWDFVNVPQFSSGFDAFVQLPNGVTYATKGDSYVRYSNERIAYVE